MKQIQTAAQHSVLRYNVLKSQPEIVIRKLDLWKFTLMPYHLIAQRSGRPTQGHSNHASHWLAHWKIKSSGEKMKNSISQSSSVFLFLTVLLSACSGQIPIEPTATIAPTSTETPIPSPTFTPTGTPTLPPTETPIPQPGSLSGASYLSSDTEKPFVSTVELRQGDSFTLIASGKTDSSGGYKIENINPGLYGLWVFITSQSAVISGCDDIAPPDNKWKIGVMFSGDKALTMENAYLSKALLLVENLQSSDLKAEGFYAVLDNFEIKSGIENKMDVTLICQ